MRRSTGLLNRLSVLLFGAVTALIYLGLVTGGTGRFVADDPKAISYNMLGDAFAHGQAALRTVPDPHLLALPDPYSVKELDVQAKYALLDASLYHGRYYLYFGPVPGLIHALFQRLTGHQIPQDLCVYLFGLGTLLAFAALLTYLRSSFDSDKRNQVPIGTLTLFCLGGTMPYLLARPSIYHEAVLTGSCLLLSGLYCWLQARTGSNKPHSLNLLAGILLGLAVGSRIDLVFYPLTALALMTVLCFRTDVANRPAALRSLIFFAVPLILAFSLLLTYNRIRFDKWTEFGGKYQMVCSAGAVQRLDWHLFPKGATTYIGHMPHLLPFYPFVRSEDIYIAQPEWFLEGAFCGAALIAPLALLAPFGIRYQRNVAETSDSNGVRDFGIIGGVGGGAVLLLLCCLAWVATRYMHDFLPIAILLGSLGWWRIEGKLKDYATPRRLLQIAGTIALCTGIASGCALACAEWTQFHPEEGRHLAYRFDSLEASLLKRLAPGAWPALYFNRVAPLRTLGDIGGPNSATLAPATFAVEGRPIILAGYAGMPIDHIEADNVTEHPIRVEVIVNGRSAGVATLPPGCQSVPLSRPFTVQQKENALISVLLRFSYEQEPASGKLYPVMLIAL